MLKTSQASEFLKCQMSLRIEWYAVWRQEYGLIVREVFKLVKQAEDCQKDNIDEALNTTYYSF